MSWQFDCELSLEDFFWQNLKSLLNLTQLDRQYRINNQVVDILSVSPNQQIVLLELKNTEDRYVVQQLTRYYKVLSSEKPFSNQVDYSLPIRLIAIAPTFHPHNFIDQEFNSLKVEFFTFTIFQREKKFWFELKQVDTNWMRDCEIPSSFHQRILSERQKLKVLPIASKPPASLWKLIANLSQPRQSYILEIRDKILSFDSRMIEVGKTTSTCYGQRKGDNDIYKTRLCAEFIPIFPGEYRPRLMLVLPYPKKEKDEFRRLRYKQERGKGMAWAEIRHAQVWEAETAIDVFFYLGKGLSAYSFHYSLKQYSQVCSHLLGRVYEFKSLWDLLDIALSQWQENAVK